MTIQTDDAPEKALMDASPTSYASYLRELPRKIVRRKSFGFLVVALLSTVLVACKGASDIPEPKGILLRGGTLVDGSGGEPRIADIYILGDRIASITSGDTGVVSAAETLDVSGLIVAPGFIDPHTHALADLSDIREGAEARRRNDNYLFQGVTTVFVGNDGAGSSQVKREAEVLEDVGIGTNVGFFVGLGSVRSAVVGNMDRPATVAEMTAMKGMVEQAMCEGALGLSTGLYYAPQAFASTEEVVELARVAAKFGGVYDSHIRDESSYSIGLLAAIAEAIAIGDAAGLPVHIAHIKALGPDVWGLSREVIEQIEAARASGIDVTADQYPWRASGTHVSDALVPRWALDGGLEGLRVRLTDPAIRPRLVDEMREGLERRGGAEALLLTDSVGNNPESWTGMSLLELAQAQGMSPIDQAISILEDGDYRVASFVMDYEDMLSFAVQPWVMTGSDGTTGHPRKFASFPKAYEDLVVDEGLLTIPQFVRRSSALAADAFLLKDRGYVREGAIADVVVFDPQTYRPQADYKQPAMLSTGVKYLFVNGQKAIAGGVVQDVFGGRAILKYTRDVEACAQ